MARVMEEKKLVMKKKTLVKTMGRLIDLPRSKLCVLNRKLKKQLDSNKKLKRNADDRRRRRKEE